MTKLRISTAPVALTLAIAAAAVAAGGSADAERLSAPILMKGEDVQWEPGPKSLPQGAEIAILEGDLTEEEAYTMRLRFPDGYRVPPHSHPVREHITVLEGTLMMGMGKTFDREAVTPLGADRSLSCLKAITTMSGRKARRSCSYTGQARGASPT